MDRGKLSKNLQETRTFMEGSHKDLSTMNDFAERTKVVANNILNSLQAVNLMRCRKLAELQAILGNYNPTLRINIKNVNMFDVNSGRFNAEGMLRLNPGEPERVFPLPVNIHDPNLEIMAREVLKHIGTGFDFLLELDAF